MIEGVDYAWARPEPAALRKAGKVFAGRYVGVGSQGKRLTLSEAMALTRGGVSIVALCEQSAQSALGGHARGATHAALARAEAAACGMPPGHPIYFAVDWDASDAELATVRAYFEGIHTVLPHRQVGVYGGIRTVMWALNNGLAAWGFQTYAWSGGRWDRRAAIQQYRNGVTVAGSTVDLCRATVAYFGQWTVGGARPPGEDDDMPTVQEIWAADEIPVGNDPNNPNWLAKDVMGRTFEQVMEIREAVGEMAAAVAVPPQSTVTLSAEDRESIVSEITEAVTARIGLIPTAAEIARATAAELQQRLET